MGTFNFNSRTSERLSWLLMRGLWEIEKPKEKGKVKSAMKWLKIHDINDYLNNGTL